MNFSEKYSVSLVTLSVRHLKAMLYTQLVILFQYYALKNVFANREFLALRLFFNIIYQGRNMKITQFTILETFAKSP